MKNTYSKAGNANNKQEPTEVQPIKMPKNVRQIGSIGANNKVIYVEDYVMTFMKQISSKEYTGCRVAILLGYYIRTGECKNLFIKGAVEMQNTDFDNEITFSDEGWTSIYENIKKYFTDVEIVGWSLIGPEFFLEGGEKIRRIHIENFSGADKTLLKMDSMEKDEAFYLYENNQLVKQTGYYIYYEKNEEMQNYMVENKEVVSNEQSYNEQTTKKIRNLVQKKKEPIEEKKVVRLLYAASTLLAVIVLVIAATMLTNYDQLKNMETAINAISDNLMNKEPETSEDIKPADESQVVKENETSDESQTIEANQVTDNSKVTEENLKAVVGQTVKDNQAIADGETVDANTDETQSAAETKETMEVETISGNVSLKDEANTEKAKETVEASEKEENSVEDITDKSDDNKQAVEEETAETKKEETAKTQTVEEVSNSEKTKEKATQTVAEPKYYVVQAGDSLVSICYDLYNSANYMKTIMELNGIENEDVILEGQKLLIP